MSHSTYGRPWPTAIHSPGAGLSTGLIGWTITGVSTRSGEKRVKADSMPPCSATFRAHEARRFASNLGGSSGSM